MGTCVRRGMANDRKFKAPRRKEVHERNEGHCHGHQAVVLGLEKSRQDHNADEPERPHAPAGRDCPERRLNHFPGQVFVIGHRLQAFVG